MAVLKYFVFCLIICFILIRDTNSKKNCDNCNSVSYEHGTQNFYSNIVVHKHITENCRAPEHKSELKKNVKRFMCQPMNTVVHLYSNDENVMMIPDKVVVKRCYETGCYGRNSCIANNTREIPVAVRFVNAIPQKNQKTCGWVKVIEHVQCRCGCNIDKDECEKSGKIYNAQDCSCRCSNEEKLKSECQKQLSREWDEDTCSCKCKTQMMDCTTGTEWVPKHCRCLQVMM